MEGSTLTSAVVITSLILGILCLLNSNYIWFKKQVFGIGGGALTLTGAILIIGSLWERIAISATTIEVELDRKIAEVTKAT